MDVDGLVDAQLAKKTFLDNHESAGTTNQHPKADARPDDDQFRPYGIWRRTSRIYDLGLLDARGNITNLLLKGEMFTIRECIRFHADIQSPIFTYTIKR